MGKDANESDFQRRGRTIQRKTLGNGHEKKIWRRKKKILKCNVHSLT